MLIKEFRVIMPMTVDEYQIAQLWSVAEMSKAETGGGEGIEVIVNDPFDKVDNRPEPLLLGGAPQYTNGQYTYKRYYLQSKVPAFVRLLAPKGSLEIDEKAWNAYPYCRTVIDNPLYMKEKFHIKIESMHIQETVDEANVHQLSPEQLKQREVIYIDIANDKCISEADYKAEADPAKYHSLKTGRGPLVGPHWWKNTHMPIMCCYKLVTCEFKWWGVQNRIENFIMKQERRLFLNFHRHLFCWTDNWHGLSMDDIRIFEAKTKDDLDEQRRRGSVRGTKAEE